MFMRIVTALAACIALAAVAGIQPSQAAPETEPTCLAKPGAPPTDGRHWYYNTDRTTKKRCWYLAQRGLKTTSAKSARKIAAASAKTKAATTRLSRSAARAQARALKEQKEQEEVDNAMGAELEPESDQTVLGRRVASVSAPHFVPSPAPVSDEMLLNADTSIATVASEDHMTGASERPADPQGMDELQLSGASVWPEPPVRAEATAPAPQPTAAAPGEPSSYPAGVMLGLVLGSLALAGLSVRTILRSVHRPNV